MGDTMTTDAKPRRWVHARHEAAHAIVAVRAGLPLVSTDIQCGRPIPADVEAVLPTGHAMHVAGFTTCGEGLVERWVRALPDVEAARNLRRSAAMAAAGLVAEMMNGGSRFDENCRGDLLHVASMAHWLGVGSSCHDPAVQRFVDTAQDRAYRALIQDDGQAWDRVTAALLADPWDFLAGDDVRAIVTDIDGTLPLTRGT